MLLRGTHTIGVDFGLRAGASAGAASSRWPSSAAARTCNSCVNTGRTSGCVSANSSTGVKILLFLLHLKFGACFATSVAFFEILQKAPGPIEDISFRSGSTLGVVYVPPAFDGTLVGIP